MPRYRLVNDVYWCEPSGAVIFLDLKRDRYIGLEPENLAAFRRLIDPDLPPDAQTEALGRQLVEEGLLVTNANAAHGKIPSATACPPIAAALIDLGDTSHVRIRPIHVARFALACARAAYLRRCSALHAIVQRIRERRARYHGGMRTPRRTELRDLVARFRRLRPLAYSAPDHCVLDALTLIEFLALFGHFPNWTLGVMTQPFGAHCWVQHGEIVLSDSVTRAGVYTPIMVA
jgi:hypothetical protein